MDALGFRLFGNRNAINRRHRNVKKIERRRLNDLNLGRFLREHRDAAAMTVIVKLTEARR